MIHMRIISLLPSLLMPLFGRWTILKCEEATTFDLGSLFSVAFSSEAANVRVIYARRHKKLRVTQGYCLRS
jgi:hypothetical protein